MKKKLFLLNAAILLAVSSTMVQADKVTTPSHTKADSYYELASKKINIIKDGTYQVKLKAEKDWVFDVQAGDDVTTWLVNKKKKAALGDKSGVATVSNISKDKKTLTLTVDAAKITSFTSNGGANLYIEPSTDAIKGAGDNHAHYEMTSVLIGDYVIPKVTMTGKLDGKWTSKDGLKFQDNKVTFKLSLGKKKVDSSLINAEKAQIQLNDGDGYYASDYTFKNQGLSNDWSKASSTYTIKAEDLQLTNDGYQLGQNGGGRSWSELGGDGNGHYHLNFSLEGLEYNGLPVTHKSFRAHIYAYGRTFQVDNDSIYAKNTAEWSTDTAGGRPILCDDYTDHLNIKWASGFDASKLKDKDFSLTMKSDYGDTLALKAGRDFTISTEKDKTSIKLSYIYWANTPVYTHLYVNVAKNNLSWNKKIYQVGKISHTYDIASVYVYNVMAGGQKGTQTWTIYGFDGIKSTSQIFNTPTYTLTYTDTSGKLCYYSEANGGTFVDESSATKFDATKDVNLQVIGNTGYFARQFDQTEDKVVNGQNYTLTKVYSPAESALKAPNECTDVTVKPGFIIGKSWEDHLRWSWQGFINQGYQGGHA